MIRAKQLALSLKTPVQVLLCRAINELLTKHGVAARADEVILPRGGAAHAARRRT
jgi:hypothetical protein